MAWKTTGTAFLPKKSGVRGPGQVVRDEHLKYQNPLYARTLEITPDQYAKLKHFGELGAAGKAGGFDLYYNGATNSCIYYTWAALERAGIHTRRRPLHAADDNLELRDFEGNLKPVDNIHRLQRIVPPVPESRYNTEQHHPMPEREWWHKLITDAEAATPSQLASDPRVQQIRDAVHRVDAAHGRAPYDASERLAASLYAGVAGNTLIRRVDDVVLSNATPGQAAGATAFAVYRPFGEREPSFHSSVDVASALATPAPTHYRNAELAAPDLARSSERQQAVEANVEPAHRATARSV